MSDKTNSVIEFAYKAFVPVQKNREKIDIAAENIKSFLLKKINELKINAEVTFAGSYAKNTWIKNASDIDVYVSFESEKATGMLSKLIPKGFVPQHGTRLYFRGFVTGIVVEVIPLVKFKDIKDVENSVDLSILHADYVKSRINEKLRRDIIVLKQFCKANGCYGSETYIHGFSGYSLELLIIKYKGILELFEEVLSWKPGVYVDIEKAYVDMAAALEIIGVRESPLILVDPTNPKRNVCGSLNTENFAKFVFSVKKFMAKPSKELLKESDESKILLGLSKIRGTKLFRYSTKIIGPRDKFLSMYNKNLAKLINELKKNDVSVYDCNAIYNADSVEVFLQIENVPKTKTRRILGPNVWLDFENFNKFLKEHRDAYVYKEFAAYDKEYNIENFNAFILSEIKEYIDSKAILKS